MVRNFSRELMQSDLRIGPGHLLQVWGDEFARTALPSAERTSKE